MVAGRGGWAQHVKQGADFNPNGTSPFGSMRPSQKANLSKIVPRHDVILRHPTASQFGRPSGSLLRYCRWYYGQDAA